MRRQALSRVSISYQLKIASENNCPTWPCLLSISSNRLAVQRADTESQIFGTLLFEVLTPSCFLCRNSFLTAG